MSPRLLSKEAELFEKANIVDVGMQPNEFKKSPLLRHRSLSQSMESLSLDQLGTHHHEAGFSGNASAQDNGANEEEAEKANSGDGEDEEEDEELNIDEVDAVNHAVEEGLVDNNLVVDEAYSHSLSERANQFLSHDSSSIMTFPEVPKPVVDYELDDVIDMRRELDDWFSAMEVDELSTLPQRFQEAFPNINFNRLPINDQEALVEQLISELNTEGCDVALPNLVYIAFGAPSEMKFTFEDQVHIIRHNTMFLVRSKLIQKVIPLLKTTFKLALIADTGLVKLSKRIFMSCTLLYVVVLVYLDNNSVDDDESEDLKKIIDEEELLKFLIRCTDDWRWNSRACLKIRNIITLLSKLLQFQIGGFEKRRKAKEFICERLNIKKEDDPNKLTGSPVDFHLFREEIIARYPGYIPPAQYPAPNVDNPSSLSQFLTMPRPIQPTRNPNNVDTFSQQIHIATPAPSPSPPTSPLSRSLKGKKIFRTNESYPFIYPVEDDTKMVPDSIKEASELFASRVQEKLSLKQLWAERDIFVKQERGWVDPVVDENVDFDYSRWKSTQHQDLLDSLSRVEQLYKSSLSHLASMVHVIIQLVVSSQNSMNLLLDKEVRGSDIDILRTKEILLKNATSILHLLLRWFKTNHILQFEYLSGLIYDFNFLSVVIQYLNTMDTRLLDRINLIDAYVPTNSLWVDNPAVETIDKNFCCSLVNLLQITSMVCQKKTQRILSISELNPAPALKNILSLSNPSLWSPVLKISKQITSFNGKKWKANNMDLISMVYIHGKLDLKDNWLSGRDIDAEVADAYGQEIALRALVQFFNSRRYGDTMKELGYTSKRGDFFTREIELISSDL
ncbi:unnamed protein product [Cyberlindnera jadinii]|uniref:N1221-domain-containing protein n=1 Tax=Cyberlindnera jadinii (strain ATCC 18201 / CBS 1600 / BCRC 20928 / JCM 3617 / NBRC 0987 / NRRL Y-1542) TaxID=983966 RepID=A0A0H5C675_CYBJN|nr:unnamed protein product [Cyberlindnera jadinii]